MTKLKILAAVGLLLCVSESGFACSCAKFISVADEFKRARVVFAGEVISISGPKSRRQRNSRGRLYGEVVSYLEIRFKVSQVWKGVDLGTMVVETDTAGSSCYRPYAVGESYLVYAKGGYAGRLHINMCARTPLLNSAEEDLRELGPGKAMP